MEDCPQRQSGSVNLRQKGRNCRNGRIVKGCVQDAGSKVSIGSIPSTYEAIIYRNNSTQAFGTSSFRFHQTSDFVNLAPDQYKKEDASVYRWKSQQGFNRKGTGPFLSKEKRVFKVGASTPGPGKYDLSTTVRTADTETPNVTAAKYQAALSRQLKRFQEKENVNPGPCDYDPKTAVTQSVGWKSSFQSKVSRDEYLQLCSTPGPGAYELKLLSRKINKSPPKKPEASATNIQHTILKLMNTYEHKPREYSYAIPDFQPKYSKIKNSPIFVEGSKDRFGDYRRNPIECTAPLKDELPGPGSYKIASEFEVPKLDMSGSYFASETVRKVFDKVDQKLGPNVQEVFLLGKKQFHLNMDKKWI